MRQKQSLLGFDPLTAKATLFGHSEGSFITFMARERLQKAGLPDAIGKLVVMAGGLGARHDAQWAPFLVMRGYEQAVDKLGHPSNLAEVTRSYDKIVGSFFGKEKLVDLGVAGRIGPPVRLTGLKIENLNDIRPGMRFAAVGEAGFELLSKPWKAWSTDLLKLVSRKSTDDTDGLVKYEWAKFGSKSLLLQRPHDHANMIEDPSVVDEIAGALP
jgi:pimeloyl-ACP methyl ester carboxylesterase